MLIFFYHYSRGTSVALKKRQQAILKALKDFGGQATTRQIADQLGLHVNGVAQSLGALYEFVECLGGRGGATKWKIK